MTAARDIAAKPPAQRGGERSRVGGGGVASRETARHGSSATPAQGISILDAIDDPSVWGGWFKDPETWRPWRAFLSVLFGLPLDPASLELYRQCTGRQHPPVTGFVEAWLVCGRRAGKSFILALIAVYLAVFRDWRPYLSPGEVGMIKVIATDRRQARVIHRYCRALLTQVPAFASLIATDSDDAIELTNRVTIEIQTASFRSVRGFTLVAILADEIAFWRSDETAANPDAEIMAALRPAMATIPGAMLLAASSPYARRGELWNAHRQYHGQDDAPVLVWQAATRTMNPTVPQSVVDEAMERDPARAASEFLAQFRSDIEGFVSRDVVDAAVVPGRHELPHLAKTSYHAFTDPAGGSGNDSMTLAVAHRDGDGRAVLDLVRERRPPFSPEQVAADFAQTLRSYGVRRVTGDRYAGEWPREQFRKSGIQYETSDRSKSEVYLESLPLMNSGRVELLDHPRLVGQLCGLERRTARSGKDSIDHAPGAHDDVCNAALGALLLASATKSNALVLSQPALQQFVAKTPPRDRFSRSSGMPNFSPRQLGFR